MVELPVYTRRGCQLNHCASIILSSWWIQAYTTTAWWIYNDSEGIPVRWGDRDEASSHSLMIIHGDGGWANITT